MLILMKVFPFKIPKSKPASLIYQEDRKLVFYDKLHQHEEIQISYIKKGEGTIIVGDTITAYQTGDVIILGSYLPHVFRSAVAAVKVTSVMQTIFFTKGAFGNDFFDLPEFKKLSSFFHAMQNGLILKAAKNELSVQFDLFKQADAYDRLALFLNLIRAIGQSKLAVLSRFVYDKPFTDVEGKRMRKVYEFVMNQYHTAVTLEKAAAEANMTKHAFCRYFKVRTNKTFFQFLIEIRIEQAASLLSKNSEWSVLEIAERCGFNNMSNFNRQFKAIKHLSPLQYRNRK
jgi:AraC-like DNA-binding protein